MHMVNSEKLVVIVVMFGSELPGGQGKMRNTLSYIALL